MSDIAFDIKNRFTSFQLELLKMSNLDLNEAELGEVKDAIAKVALKHLSRIATEAALEKGYTDKDYEAWLNDENQ